MPPVLPNLRLEPAYLRLWRAGEFSTRVEEALSRLSDCRLCPRNCGVDRLGDKKSVCRTGRYAVISSYGPHHGEEDCLRGCRGSGTVFFAWCNLRCVFCQNHEVSWRGEGRTSSAEELAAIFLRLQEQGCYNINLVTPSHVVPQILEALSISVAHGLRLPLVYNTSAYDSLNTLKLMDGIVDIYMPDFKYWDNECAKRNSNAPDYPDVARAAIKEMNRQVGPLLLDEEGMALRGVLLRHLVMPEGIAGSREIFAWIARELGSDTYVNVMSQYYPAGWVVRGVDFGEINRCVTSAELRQALQDAADAGLNRFQCT